MKTLLRLYIFGLIAVLFMSTTGVAVYKHYCNMSETTQSYFVKLDADCNMPEMTDESCQLECCHKDKVDRVQNSDDCCTNNMEYYHINADLINHDFKVELPKILPSIHIVGLSLEDGAMVQENGFIVVNPPPILTTPQRLSLFQTYLI